METIAVVEIVNQDVEGHGRRGPFADDDRDVEGRGRRGPFADDDLDVEGHMPRVRFALAGPSIDKGRDAGDEDIEGHSQRGALTYEHGLDVFGYVPLILAVSTARSGPGSRAAEQDEAVVEDPRLRRHLVEVAEEDVEGHMPRVRAVLIEDPVPEGPTDEISPESGARRGGYATEDEDQDDVEGHGRNAP